MGDAIKHKVDYHRLLAWHIQHDIRCVCERFLYAFLEKPRVAMPATVSKVV
jgi:hypothetical protein